MRRPKEEPLVTDAYASLGSPRITPPHGVPWPWPSNTQKTWRKSATWELLVGAFVGIFTVPFALFWIAQALAGRQPLSSGEMTGLGLLCVFMIGIPAGFLIAGTRAFLRHGRQDGPVRHSQRKPRRRHHR